MEITNVLGRLFGHGISPGFEILKLSSRSMSTSDKGIGVALMMCLRPLGPLKRKVLLGRRSFGGVREITDTSDTPDTPDTSDTPDTPDTPDTSDTPDTADTSGLCSFLSNAPSLLVVTSSAECFWTMTGLRAFRAPCTVRAANTAIAISENRGKKRTMFCCFKVNRER